jgi:hypothetical protein
VSRIRKGKREKTGTSNAGWAACGQVRHVVHTGCNFLWNLTMYSERQKQILAEITQGLGLPEPEMDAVQVEQSPGYIDSVVETADFAVALMGAIGSAAHIDLRPASEGQLAEGKVSLPEPLPGATAPVDATICTDRPCLGRERWAGCR